MGEFVDAVMQGDFELGVSMQRSKRRQHTPLPLIVKKLHLRTICLSALLLAWY